MGSHRLCNMNLWFSISWFCLFIDVLSSHSLFHGHRSHHNGVPTNVTKHLHFSNFTQQNDHQTIIKLLGSASIAQHEGFIQIPDPSSPAAGLDHQAGRALYSSPIRLFDPLTASPASFRSTFSFQFSGNGGSGLAFVIVPDEFTVGRSGPWLGIVNDACEHYKVFAVEFDNSDDGSVGDPNDDHVGINLGSPVSFKTADSSRFKASSLHRRDVIHRAWISYDGYRKWIEVYLGVDGHPLPSGPLLSTSLDLSPHLNEYMFVGFSASTGETPQQIHRILSWDFFATTQAMLSVPQSHTCHKNIAHQVSKYSSVTGHAKAPSSFFIFMCLFGLFSVTFLNLYCKRTTSENESYPFKKQRPLPPDRPRRFLILELYRASKHFSKTEVLASDNRGVLYRGTLPNGCCVAVKRFSRLEKTTIHEAAVLKRISSITRHVTCLSSNLAAIRGWCCDNREMMIVYHYYHNGTLDRWLYGVGVLPWSRRFRLIKDVARSLRFLHSKEIAHGNLKSSSVFLDANYETVLGDYGFTTTGSGCCKKEDVFGFGMLVLEIVSGRKTTECTERMMDALGFAWDMHEKGEMAKVIDERMNSNVNIEQAVRVLEIGLACTFCDEQINSDRTICRPSMEEVLQILDMKKPTPKLPRTHPPNCCLKMHRPVASVEL